MLNAGEQTPAAAQLPLLYESYPLQTLLLQRALEQRASQKLRVLVSLHQRHSPQAPRVEMMTPPKPNTEPTSVRLSNNDGIRRKLVLAGTLRLPGIHPEGAE